MHARKYNVQVNLQKFEYGEKYFFSCNLFQKVKLSYIFWFITCKVKHFNIFFALISMIRAYS